MTKANELNWINVSAETLSGEERKLYDAMCKAREAFKQHMVAKARKANAIGQNETLIITFKAWGFGMAKAAAKGGKAPVKATDLFGNL